jgi:uncharacterized protein YxjI
MKRIMRPQILTVGTVTEDKQANTIRIEGWTFKYTKTQDFLANVLRRWYQPCTTYHIGVDKDGLNDICGWHVHELQYIANEVNP